jgi:DNA polymerase III delta subunit
MATVLDEIRTPSMFCPKKLVIVDPADNLLKTPDDDDAPKGKRPVLSNRELLENYLESPADSGVLVLVCEKWLKTTRLHKQLDKRSGVRWAESIKPYQATAWISKRSRDAYNKAIDPAAAARLADLIGPDLQRLDNELAKLSLYKPQDPAITADTVDALVGFQHEQQIWDLISALAAKDAPSALKKIDELWQMDPNLEYSAVGAVASWLTTVLKAREMIDKRMPDGVIMRDLKLWPEDRARKVLSLARGWGLAGSARWSETLLRMDVANKSGLGEPRRNLERFIVALAN